MRIPVGNLQAALTVTLPFPFAGQQRVIGDPHGGDDPLDGTGERLAGQVVNGRLMVESVEMTGPTVHEQEDDAGGRTGEMPRFRSERIERPGRALYFRRSLSRRDDPREYP